MTTLPLGNWGLFSLSFYAKNFLHKIVDIPGGLCYNGTIKKGKAQEVKIMKYNKAEIMRNAWSMFRHSKKTCTRPLTFGECLSRVWAKAKHDARTFSGVVRGVAVAGTLCHPVRVDIDLDDCTVSGNTFNAKQTLKAAGLTWDAKRRVWVGSRETLHALCVKYA